MTQFLPSTGKSLHHIATEQGKPLATGTARLGRDRIQTGTGKQQKKICEHPVRHSLKNIYEVQSRTENMK